MEGSVENPKLAAALRPVLREHLRILLLHQLVAHLPREIAWNGKCGTGAVRGPASAPECARRHYGRSDNRRLIETFRVAGWALRRRSGRLRPGCDWNGGRYVDRQWATRRSPDRD